VYWSCINSHGGCGGSSIALADRVFPGFESVVNGIYPIGSLVGLPTLRQWGAIVGDYTNRSLGREGDKLWAVSALAQHMVSASKARGEDAAYVAGLLVDQAEPETWLLQLLWYPLAQDTKRPRLYRAPSWSWASIDGPVESPPWQSDMIHYAAVENWKVTPLVEAAPYGALSSGHLIFSAKVHNLSRMRAVSSMSWGSWGHHDLSTRSWESGPWGKIEGSESKWVLILVVDCPVDRKMVETSLNNGETGSSSLFLAAVLTLSGGVLAGVQGLLVRSNANGSSDGPCRRLGSFQLRAGKQDRRRPESSVLRFFNEAETRRLRIL